MVEKSSKYIVNKCSHWSLRLIAKQDGGPSVVGPRQQRESREHLEKCFVSDIRGNDVQGSRQGNLDAARLVHGLAKRGRDLCVHETRGTPGKELFCCEGNHSGETRDEMSRLMTRRTQ